MYSPQTPDTSASVPISSRRQRTASSIRRLFRSKSSQHHELKPTTVSSTIGNVLQQTALISAPVPQSSPATANLVFRAVTDQNTHHLAREERPMSSRSSRSVRSIFSSTKRISLRPSILFKRKENTVEPMECIPWSSEPPLTTSTSPAAGNIASHGDVNSAEPTCTHNATGYDTSSNAISAAAAASSAAEKSNRDKLLQELQLLAQGNKPIPLRDAQEHLQTPALPAASLAEHNINHRRPAPTLPLPALPVITVAQRKYSAPPISSPTQIATPPSSTSTAASTAMSPYSSKSLGLQSLDFGYNGESVSNLMPPAATGAGVSSSHDELLANENDNGNGGNGSNRPLSDGVLGSTAVFNPTDNLSDTVWPVQGCDTEDYIELPEEEAAQPACYSDIVHADIPPVDLVDIKLLDQLDDINERMHPSDSLPTLATLGSVHTENTSSGCPYSSLISAGNRPVVTLDVPQIIYDLGSATALGPDVLSPDASPTSVPTANKADDVPLSSPQFSISDIDELLAELGFSADKLQATTTAAGYSLGTSPLASSNVAAIAAATDSEQRIKGLHARSSVASDSEMFSLRDIDELIEQLNEAAVRDSAVASRISAISPKLTQYRNTLLDASPSQYDKDIKECTNEPAVSSGDLVVQLGSADKLTQAIVVVTREEPYSEDTLAENDSTCLVDAAELVRRLGSIVDVPLVIPEQRHPSRIYTVKAEDAISVNALLPTRLDIDALISELGNVMSILPPPPQPSLATHPPPVFSSTLVSPLLNVSELIAALGNVCAVVVDAAVLPSSAPELLTPYVESNNGSSIDNNAAVIDTTVLQPVSEELVDAPALIASLGNIDTITSCVPPPQTLEETLHLVDQPPAQQITETCSSSSSSSSSTATTSPTFSASELIAELGGVYSPDFLFHSMERVRKASTQTLVDHDLIANDNQQGKQQVDPYNARSYKQDFVGAFGKDKVPVGRSPSFVSMDVDEKVQDPRSRATSVSRDSQDGSLILTAGVDHPAYNMSRLLDVLRIPPIVVSRPFLGPSRKVLFTHFC